MHQIMMNKIPIVLVVAVVAFCLVALAAPNGEQQATELGQNVSDGNNSCGSISELSKHVEQCAKPAMDIVEGTMEKWPRNEEDSHELCVNLTGAEKCMREEGRRCAKGLQKTIISTLANSVQRARKRECVSSNYAEIQRTMECIEKNQDKFRFLVANVTNVFKAMDKQMSEADRKINGLCCNIINMENGMKNLLNTVCPKQTTMVMRLYGAILDDTFELVCRKAKCGNVFRGVVFDPVRLDPDKHKHSGLVAVILSMIFSLDSPE